MTIKRLILAICFLAISINAFAVNSAEIKVTLGEGYQGYKATAGADFDQAGMWSADVSMAHAQYSDSETAGWNRFYFMALNWMPGDDLSFSANYSHALDNHDIVTTGPGFSAFYTRFKNTAWDQTPHDVFTLGVDCPVLFYRAELTTSSDPVLTRKIELTQTAPMLFLDVALVPNVLNANVSGSYFIYSDDPVQIASVVDPSVSASAAESLESLMLTMLWMSWHTGVFINLPRKIQISANYGRQKQVYPEEWVDHIDLGLSARLFRFLKAKAAWRHFSSSASQSDLFSIALRFYY